MSVITQKGNSALMLGAQEGMTEVIPMLLEAGANIDLQNRVCVGVVSIPLYFLILGAYVQQVIIIIGPHVFPWESRQFMVPI